MELLIKYVSAELTGDVDAEEPNNVEDDEEDGIEVDNGEEALDTYDGHDLVLIFQLCDVNCFLRNDYLLAHFPFSNYS